MYDGYKDKNTIEVADWVKTFYDAKFVITDSFHGVCLSIIFNKPFVGIKNKDRGTARFDSLIEIFNIENNFVSSITDVLDKQLSINMDYSAINKILESEKNRCIEILKEVLLNDYSNNKNAKLGKVVNYTSNKLSSDTTSINTKIDEVANKHIADTLSTNTRIDEVSNKYNNLLLYLNRNKVYKRYYRYKLFSKIFFGKKRKHYKEKAKIFHEKVRAIRKLIKSQIF